VKELAVARLSPHARGAAWEVLVEVSIEPPGVAKHRMASRGESANNAALQELYAELPSVPVPSVRTGAVAFQLLFGVGCSRSPSRSRQLRERLLPEPLPHDPEQPRVVDGLR